MASCFLKNNTFNKENWKWSKFQKYLIFKLNQYSCKNYKIPSQYSFKEETYGSKKNIKKVFLSTQAAYNERINFCRSVSIKSPSYSVLNFLIIPNTKYNIPFFGVDFVSLPKYHLIVLDFQPSLNVNKQFDKELLDQLLNIKDKFHQKVLMAEKMSDQIAQFFSPAVIWSKLEKSKESDRLIEDFLFLTFKQYINIYLNLLFKAQEAYLDIQSELVKGQNSYLDYRKRNDPARPMLKVLFGEDFTESLINNVLFKVK